MPGFLSIPELRECYERWKGNKDMEHIDALEAVRRLTLERDALAAQVKRLEERLKAAFRFDVKDYLLTEQVKLLKERDAPQAPERRERPETDAETGEGGNGAPRGCDVPSRTCETCKHWIENTRPGYMSTGYCHCHAPIANPDGPESLAHFPLTAHNVRCGEWEART